MTSTSDKGKKPPPKNGDGKSSGEGKGDAKALADWNSIVEQCPALGHASRSRGGQHAEFTRTAVVGVAKHCEGGRVIMHALCESAPGYDEKGLDEKFDAWGEGKRKSGPPTCKQIDTAMKKERGEGCIATCPHHASGECAFKSPVELGGGPRSALNYIGEKVVCEIENPRKAECIVQACDYVGIEPYYDMFTQKTVFRRRDLGNRWQKHSTAAVLLAQSDAEAKCWTPGAGGNMRPAVFGDTKFGQMLDTLSDDRFKHRHVNIVRDILDSLYPAEVCTKADHEFMLDWFIDEWKAVCRSEKDRDLIRLVTEQFGVNLFSRGMDPGAQVRFQPLLLGDGELGKSQFVRRILPPEAQALKLCAGSLDLTKDAEKLVKEQTDFLLAEYAEIESIHGAQIGKIKDFLTATEQGARPLYRDSQRIYRMTAVGCATGNLDRQPMPDSRELKMRLIHIEVTDSPFGPADGPYGGNAERYFTETGARDRLWRGWGYAYHHLGHRGDRGLGEMTAHMLERAEPFTFMKSEVGIMIDEILAIAEKRSALDDLDLVDKGATTAEMVKALRDNTVGIDIPKNATVEIGKSLRSHGFTSIRRKGNHALRWIYPPFASNPDMVREAVEAEKRRGDEIDF